MAHRDVGAVHVDLAFHQDPVADLLLAGLGLDHGLAGPAGLALALGLGQQFGAWGTAPSKRARAASRVGQPMPWVGSCLATRRCSRRPGVVRRPLMRSRSASPTPGSLHHDAVAIGAGGGDLGFGHAELVDAVLDDLRGPACWRRPSAASGRSAFWVRRKLSPSKADVVARKKSWRSFSTVGFWSARVPSTLTGIAIHAHHGVREALLLEAGPRRSWVSRRSASRASWPWTSSSKWTPPLRSRPRRTLERGRKK